jgi:hypothetical protein
MVNAVAEKHPVFAVETRPAAEHKQEIEDFDLGTHGVVCVSSTGNVLWKHAGHELSEEALASAVSELLAALQDGE